MNDQDQLVSTDLLVISFQLGNAAFGIDAQRVQEVARVSDLTPVRGAPGYVIGIRNLRGRIVTIIDLRSLLGLGQITPGPQNRVLIIDAEEEPIGLVVDSISDTVVVPTSQVTPPPPNLHGVQRRNLKGVCPGHGRLVGLLDLDILFHSGEIS